MTQATPYQSFPNSFKRDLLAGKRLIGCWSSLANAITTEVLGVAGFDWILLDGEHSPNDVTTFIPQLMALKDSPSAPVVRPASNNEVEMKRLLDAGFYNFLVPFVESADEALRAVRATRYPPQGVRGVSVSQRSNRYGTVPDYFKSINDHICVMVQIESRADARSFVQPDRRPKKDGAADSGRRADERRGWMSGVRSGVSLTPLGQSGCIGFGCSAPNLARRHMVSRTPTHPI